VTFKLELDSVKLNQHAKLPKFQVTGHLVQELLPRHRPDKLD